MFIKIVNDNSVGMSISLLWCIMFVKPWGCQNVLVCRSRSMILCKEKKKKRQKSYIILEGKILHKRSLIVSWIDINYMHVLKMMNMKLVSNSPVSRYAAWDHSKMINVLPIYSIDRIANGPGTKNCESHMMYVNPHKRKYDIYVYTCFFLMGICPTKKRTRGERWR